MRTFVMAGIILACLTGSAYAQQVQVRSISDQTLLRALFVQLVSNIGMDAEHYEIQPISEDGIPDILEVHALKRTRFLMTVYILPEQIGFIEFSKWAQDHFTQSCAGRLLDYVFNRVPVDHVDEAVLSSSQCSEPGHAYRSTISFLLVDDYVLAIRNGTFVLEDPDNPGKDWGDDPEMKLHGDLANGLATMSGEVFARFVEAHSKPGQAP